MALPAWHRRGVSCFSDEVIEAHRSACASCESPTPSTRLGDIGFGIGVLRGKLDRADLGLSKPRIVREILHQSQILDQDLMSWRISVPREWEKFSFVSPKEHEQLSEDGRLTRTPTWLGYSASYPDLMTASVLNHFRMHNIALQAINIQCTNWIARYGSVEVPASELPMTEDTTTAHHSSIDSTQKVIRTMVDGICASVPFHLDSLALNRKKESLGDAKSGKRFNQTGSGKIDLTSSSKSSPVLKGPERPAGGFMLLAPLVTAYSAPGVPADQKTWILGKSLEIAKQFGVDEEMIKEVFNKVASS